MGEHCGRVARGHQFAVGAVEREAPDGRDLFSFDQALEAADRIGARNTYLIHMSHDLSHVEIERYVDDRIEKYPNLAKAKKSGGYVGPAWDGLVLETE